MTLEDAQASVDAALRKNFPNQRDEERMDRIIVRIMENPEYPSQFEAALHCPVRDRFAVMQAVRQALHGETVTFP